MVSIVLPVYRQADFIGPTVQAYQHALARFPHSYEMILVVNGEGDNSLDVCHALAARFPNVRTVHTEEPGWGRAVKHGLHHARADVLCYTNTARTGAGDLLLMLLYAVAHPGVVIKANRRIRDSAARRVGSVLFNLECRALFDLATWDINGTPKVFPRAFDKLLTLSRNDDLIDAEFVATCRQAEYPMLEVPILFSQRHGGVSTTNYRSAARMYWRAFGLWRSLRHRASWRHDGIRSEDAE
jgi:glycosyltransferase involved in cell wall biosynthesis